MDLRIVSTLLIEADLDLFRNTEMTMRGKIKKCVLLRVILPWVNVRLINYFMKVIKYFLYITKNNNRLIKSV